MRIGMLRLMMFWIIIWQKFKVHSFEWIISCFLSRLFDILENYIRKNKNNSIELVSNNFGLVWSRRTSIGTKQCYQKLTKKTRKRFRICSRQDLWVGFGKFFFETVKTNVEENFSSKKQDKHALSMARQHEFWQKSLFSLFF